MDNQVWSDVDSYINDHLLGKDDVLEKVLFNTTQAGLPNIQVSAAQGKLLYQLALMVKAKNILEIATLGGYSAISMTRALPKCGKLVTLEADLRHVEVAKNNVRLAGLENIIDIKIGKALDTLPLLVRSQPQKFDVIFIDADKENIPHYYDWSIKLSHSASIIIVDNVVRQGQILQAESNDLRIRGVRHFYEIVGQDKRVTATTMQTVGSKGYDGFCLIHVL